MNSKALQMALQSAANPRRSTRRRGLANGQPNTSNSTPPAEDVPKASAGNRKPSQATKGKASKKVIAAMAEDSSTKPATCKRTKSDVEEPAEPSKSKRKKAGSLTTTTTQPDPNSRWPRVPKAPDLEASETDNEVPVNRNAHSKALSPRDVPSELIGWNLVSASKHSKSSCTQVAEATQDDQDGSDGSLLTSDSSSNSDEDSHSSRSTSDDNNDPACLMNNSDALEIALETERAKWINDAVPVSRTSQGPSSTALPVRQQRTSDWAKRRDERPEWVDERDKNQSVVTTPKGSNRPSLGVPRSQAVKIEDRGPLVDLTNEPEDPPPHDDSIELVYSAKGGDLNLTEQHPRVAALLRVTIAKVLLDIVCVNAFPDALRHSTVANALLECAGALNDPGLLNRLEQDRDYRDALTKIPAQRVSNFRGEIKKKTDALVDGYYGCSRFEDRDELLDAIDWLKEEGMYHYPCDPKKREFEGGKPFGHPIIEATFKQTIFQIRKHRSCFGPTQVTDLCESSLLDRPEEKELPIVAVSLIATAVYALLNDWSTGARKTADFNAESFTDVYKLNIELLKTIKAKSLKKYHVLMHRLFKKAIGEAKAPAKKGSQTTIEKMLQAVDIDAMADSDTDN
ncbi:hypothetical protein DAEQUDRAFT_812741 [Daedalea quercina L-15889]|uniref:DUF6532 domain-containing protein n=1 Tax=Daedalea quercina L-15889 TaxID=1314783 RepID=A0A165P2P5_9APHY|nr:hypothetical protein DAEQUDRAFT_812741 [Daedalea quercina L-15889]